MTGGVSGRVEDRWKQAAGGYGGGGDSRRNRRLLGSRDSFMTCYCSLIIAGVMWSKVYFCFYSGAVKGRGI